MKQKGVHVSQVSAQHTKSKTLTSSRSKKALIDPACSLWFPRLQVLRRKKKTIQSQPSISANSIVHTHRTTNSLATKALFGQEPNYSWQYTFHLLGITSVPCRTLSVRKLSRISRHHFRILPNRLCTQTISNIKHHFRTLPNLPCPQAIPNIKPEVYHKRPHPQPATSKMIMIRDKALYKRDMTVFWGVIGPVIVVVVAVVSLGAFILWKKVFSSRY